MKKMLSILLVAILVFSVAVASASDYSSLSDEDLKTQYNAIRNEITARGLKAEKKTVILEQAGVQIYISGEPTITKTWNDKHYLVIPLVIVNDSGKSITVIAEEASVNGWKADAEFSDGNVPLGKKAKADLQFLLDDTDVETVEDFEDFELWFKVYDKDNWFGDKVIDHTDVITVYAAQVN